MDSVPLNPQTSFSNLVHAQGVRGTSSSTGVSSENTNPSASNSLNLVQVCRNCNNAPLNPLEFPKLTSKHSTNLQCSCITSKARVPKNEFRNPTVVNNGKLLRISMMVSSLMESKGNAMRMEVRCGIESRREWMNCLDQVQR